MIRVYLLLFFLLTGSISWSQKIIRVGDNRLDYISPSKGLANKTISCLYSDSRGLLWIGTIDGISVYDGYEFKNFMRFEIGASGIEANEIISITEDLAGRIIASTKENGIHRYSFITERFEQIITTTELGSDSNVIQILENGDLIIGLVNGETKIYTDGKLDELEAQDQFIRIVKNKNDHFIVTENGISAYQLNSREIGSRLYINSYIRGIQKMDNGTFWMATKSEMIHLSADWKEQKKLKIPIHPKREPKEVIRVRMIENEDQLWLADDWDFRRINLKQPDSIYYANWPGNLAIRALAKDSSGNVFFGTVQGLLKYARKSSTFEHMNLTKLIGESFVHKTIQKGDKLWIATDGGLIEHDFRNKSQILHVSDPTNPYTIQANRVHDLALDQNKQLWVGTGSGLSYYNPKKNQFISVDPVDWAVDLIFQSPDHLFYRNNNGINVVNTTHLTIQNINHIANSISTFEDILWSLNYDGDLFKYRFTDDTLYLEKQYADLTHVNGKVAADVNGNLWISHPHSGLYVFDPNIEELTDHYFGEDDFRGFLSTSLYLDSSNDLWIQQEEFGLIRINTLTREFQVIRHPQLYNRKWERYDAPSGIMKDGRIISGDFGAIKFYTNESLEKNQNAPNVLLSSVQINDSTLFNSIVGSTITELKDLQFDQNSITFSFTGVQFDHPTRNQYTHRLLDYDQNWVSSNGRNARYANLPSGKYSFQVKSANSDGVWSDTKTLIQFNIKPPWWNSTVAYLVYALIFFGSVYLAYSFRMRRRIELAETKRVKEIEAFKTTFFMNITHEFRTPLTILLGTARKLNNHAGNIIEKSGNQLLMLVNQLLELGKLEADRGSIHWIQIDVIRYVTYLAESFESIASENEIQIRVKSEIEHLIMDADKEKLQIILNNLISNAIKFSDHGAFIELKLRTEKAQLVVTVSNTGQGIPQDKLEHIFDRYYSDPANEMGTGIGLSLTKELVTLLEGSVNVKSELGKGTDMIICLPIHNDALFEESLEETNYESFRSSVEETIKTTKSETTKLLLVEDNSSVSSYIKTVLPPQFEVITAKNGKEGLEYSLKEIPDIIISDVMMPIMDGFQMLKALKEDTASSHIPIILLTARADMDSRIDGLKIGADAYITKPFHEEELVLQIQNLISLRDVIRKKYSDGISTFMLNPKDPNDQFISSIHEFIQENIADSSLSIPDICKEIGVSRTQLHRKLKALTGKSATTFVNDLRLESAESLVRNGNITISEIAYAVGYNDPAYFTRLFTKKFGRPPSDGQDARSSS